MSWEFRLLLQIFLVERDFSGSVGFSKIRANRSALSRAVLARTSSLLASCSFMACDASRSRKRFSSATRPNTDSRLRSGIFKPNAFPDTAFLGFLNIISIYAQVLRITRLLRGSCHDLFITVAPAAPERHVKEARKIAFWGLPRIGRRSVVRCEFCRILIRNSFNLCGPISTRGVGRRPCASTHENRPAGHSTLQSRHRLASIGTLF